MIPKKSKARAPADGAKNVPSRGETAKAPPPRPGSGRASGPAKILIVDDHPLVRLGLAEFMADEPGLAVCGEAADAAEALRLVSKLAPDLAIIDLSLGNGSGLDLVKQIKAAAPAIRMLVYSMHDEMEFADRVLRAGGHGYIEKQEPPTRLVQAIHHVLRGGIHVSERVSDRLLSRGRQTEEAKAADPVALLSDRELEIFMMIGRGLTTAEIAQNLGRSVKTIETHRERIKHKLQVESGVELIRRAALWVREREEA